LVEQSREFFYRFRYDPQPWPCVSGFIVAAIVTLFAAASSAQSPRLPCDSLYVSLEECSVAANELNSGDEDNKEHSPFNDSLDLVVSRNDNLNSAMVSAAIPSSERESENFHWRRALEESVTFLAIEQSYVVHTDFRWVVVENGVPFNHYWRDYKQSLSSWVHSGWSDGDPGWFGYVGHPIQGALTSYIQIQNDPKGRRLEFSNTRAYWRSRLKATLWNAVYSTQWNLGPISEVTVEKYGAKARPPWNQNGSWPCTTKHCYTGVGQIDIVMTPVGGFGWLLGEDLLDKQVARRVERSTRNRLLIDTVRCTVNPIRAGANILHGNRPWFRARDVGDWSARQQ
jgi:hypothetical protein